LFKKDICEMIKSYLDLILIYEETRCIILLI